MLGSLEKRILSVLRKEKKTTAKEIYKALVEEGMQVQYVTVNTVLSRLSKRDLVKRTKEPFRGRFRYIYEYLEVKDQLISDFLGDVDLLFGEEGIDDLKTKLQDTEKVLSEVREQAPKKLKPVSVSEPATPLKPADSRINLSRNDTQNALIEKIEDISGQNVLACNQCGKCSAGCPLVASMDLLPNQIIRLVQLGQISEVLDSKTIWLCASCFTCDTRCPKGVDLSKIMEALRVLVLRSGKSHIDLSDQETDLPEDAPQQLLVIGSRKFTG
jgi:heterodisulfide reductase subunit C